MKGRAVASFLSLVLVLAVALFTGRDARADGAVAVAPRDAPFILEPQTVRVRALPASYSVRNLGWLRIAYPPGVAERVEPLVEHAEAVKAELAQELGQTVLGDVEVRVARDADEMVELAPAGLTPPSYAVGVAFAPLHLVLLSLRDPGSNEAPDLEEVFRHELAHVALEDAVAGHDVPRWFNEGLAIHLSGELHFKRVHTLWDATYSKNIMPLSELDSNFPSDRYQVNVAYAESADFVRFLLRDPDKARFRALVERVRGGQPFDHAIADAYGIDMRRLEYEWREELNKRYSFFPVAAGGSLVWVLVIGLMVVGYLRRRRQAKAKLAQWEREEAALDAALTRVRAPGDAPPAPEPPFPMAKPADLPRVQHDGSWHTLH